MNNPIMITKYNNHADADPVCNDVISGAALVSIPNAGWGGPTPAHRWESTGAVGCTSSVC